MHRHGYKGRKFGRQRDQRQALLRGLAQSLVLNQSVETTLPKARELRSYTEKLITKAKRGDLHARRQVLSGLGNLETGHKLVDELAPKLIGRKSGYLRIKRADERRGDGAQMAKVSFVDDLSKPLPAKKPVKSASKPVSTRKPAATKSKKTTARTAAKTARSKK